MRTRSTTCLPRLGRARRRHRGRRRLRHRPGRPGARRARRAGHRRRAGRGDADARPARARRSGRGRRRTGGAPAVPGRQRRRRHGGPGGALVHGARGEPRDPARATSRRRGGLLVEASRSARAVPLAGQRAARAPGRLRRHRRPLADGLAVAARRRLHGLPAGHLRAGRPVHGRLLRRLPGVDLDVQPGVLAAPPGGARRRARCSGELVPDGRFVERDIVYVFGARKA